MANETVKATVLKPFNYKGKLLEEGQSIELSPSAAKIYANIDAIELTKSAEKAVEAATAPEAETPAPPSKKGK